MATVGTVIIDVKADTAKLVSGMDRAEKSVKKSVENIKQSLITMASAYLGFQGASKAYDVVIKSGLAYNMQLEESKAGLVALSVAVQKDTIPIMERYANANKEATATLNELQKINASTPHTLDQTNQIYKAMYVSMKNAGASTSDLITLTKQISIAAGAGGIEFNSLLAGVDGLATGTVLANSDLGRFLSSLGLTNKALKESKDVTKLIEDKLKSFKAPDTMKVALSNLQTTWEQLAGELTKPLFDTAKQDVKDFTKVLNDNRADLLEFGLDVGRTGKLVANGYKAIYQSSTLGYLELAYTFKTEIGEILNYVTDTMVETNNYWADTWIGKKAGLEKIKIDDFLIDGKALKKQIDSTRVSLAGLGVENEKLLKDIINNTQAQKQSVKEVETSLDKKSKKSQELSDKEKKQAIDLNNAKIKAYSDYIQIVGTKEEKFQDSIANKMSALGESGVLTAEQLKKAFEKLNSEHKISLEISGIDEANKSMNSMLDSQISLAESTNAWNDGLTGVAGNIMTISKTMSKFNVDNLKSQKAQRNLDDEYAKKFIKNSDNQIATAELLKQYSKDKNTLEFQNIQNQIAGYGQLAGAVGQMYEQGSVQANAMIAIQTALSVVVGITAIANAMASGDGYTAVARGLAVAATLASFGWSGKGGGGSSAITKTPEQIKQGRLDSYSQSASDYEKNNAPMLDRLDKQIEILKSIDSVKGTYGYTLSKGVEKALADFKIGMRSSITKDVGLIGGSQNTKTAMPSYMSHEDYTKMVNSSRENYMSQFSTNKYFASQSANFFDRYDNKLSYVNRKDPYANIALNGDYLSTGTNMVKFLQELKGLGKLYESGVTTDEYNKIMGDAEHSILEFANTSLESMNKLVDMSKSFKNLVDGIRGNDFFKKDTLSNAKATVSTKIGNETLDNYLVKQIKNIQLLENNLSQQDINLLTTSRTKQSDGTYDYSSLLKQMGLATELSDDLANALANGALDALNMKDSIELVAKSMAETENNRKTLQKRLDLLKLAGDAEGTLAYNRKIEMAGIDDTNKMLLKSIYSEQDRQKAIADTNTALQSLQGSLSTVQGLRSGISENIRVLSGNRYTKDDITSGIFALNNMKTADQSKQVPLVEKMMGEYYADQKGLLKKQYDAMVTANNIAQDNARKSAQAQNDSINAWNSINSSIQGLKDFAYNYRISANPQLANNEFYKNFALLQSAIGSNNTDLVSSLSSKTQSNASAYLGTLSTSALSPNDRHEANKILAELDSLPKREDKTLVDVDASVNATTAKIGSFEDVFSYDLERLKEEQINMYSTMDMTLQKSETSIVGEITKLTAEVASLKAELATIATNTAKTASSTSATATNTQKTLLEVA